jgi:hypothetical protein
MVNKEETHYPRLYLSPAFDVVNELSVKVVHSKKRNENGQAVELLTTLEKNSICIYDRAYLSNGVLEAHQKKGNYFIFRCRSGATFKPVVEFYKSSRRQMVWVYNGMRIRLIKAKNPRTKEDLVFATNLTNERMNNKQVTALYCRRWSIETGFKDSVNQAFDQWHATTENGILQELYCHFWLMNLARLQLLIENPNKIDAWLDSMTYKKANLKLLVELLVDCVPLILKCRLTKVLALIRRHIKATLQTRKRLSRHYDRVRKYCLKRSRPASSVPRRWAA